MSCIIKRASVGHGYTVLEKPCKNFNKIFRLDNDVYKFLKEHQGEMIYNSYYDDFRFKPKSTGKETTLSRYIYQKFKSKSIKGFVHYKNRNNMDLRLCNLEVTKKKHEAA